ncbi:Eukaryotic aspartyl protease family protein [Perilla frutescens var. hirtella]|nr:Eukaryotic aspartyl protease family protein [Perilla frutescens var. hirtella]KAH6806184.1 Eukaryotic aspartyl protease family protein [Perilla frutescens var. frutescens]
MSFLPNLLHLFYLISLFSLSSAYTTTLSLSPTAASPSLANPCQRLAHLATASSTRAHHLKQPKSNISATKLPLFPRGYGGYSISLSFGTPPQTSSFVMDTGSSLVWFPCTSRYACNSCNFADVNSSSISTFIPKSSSSSKIVGCRNPKCKWMFPNVQCRDCERNSNSSSCNQSCPPYIIQYGSGSTTGLLLSESLVFPTKSVDNFVVGCSLFSSRQPSGIAGFGRGPESLPVQMGLKMFSYCLVSHRFDGSPVSSDLVLDSGGAAKTNGAKIMYTPFRKNPASSILAFQDYYYVTLRKITVGGVNVKAPYRFLVADSDGNGGTIVDSGTTFTYMEGQVFELVAAEFEKQIGKSYSRAGAVERESGLRPCYNISGEKLIDLPQLTFHFKGGAKMALPLADYFSFLEELVICMTLVTSKSMEGGVGPGPAIILGNYQQQNFYMEYDLEKERLGFRSQLCK